MPAISKIVIKPAHLCNPPPSGSEPGTKYGRLTVLEFLGRTEGSRSLMRCRCECGTEIETLLAGLKNGHCTSCGCFSTETKRATFLTHGHSHTSPAYRTWQKMKTRCLNVADRRYHDYGGRGITICERWINSFPAFLEDMGERPEGMTLDRKDNTLGYSKENCRWATRLEQQNNMRSNRLVSINGETMTITQAARYFGAKEGTFRARVQTCAAGDEVIYYGMKVTVIADRRTVV